MGKKKFSNFAAIQSFFFFFIVVPFKIKYLNIDENPAYIARYWYNVRIIYTDKNGFRTQNPEAATITFAGENSPPPRRQKVGNRNPETGGGKKIKIRDFPILMLLV